MCQLEKPRDNEITEPLAFTVCKHELRGKAIVLQSRSRRTRYYRQNETKATSFVRTKTNQGASAAERVQGGTRFSRGKQRTKNVLTQNKNKPGRKCRSVVSKMQGGIRFV